MRTHAQVPVADLQDEKRLRLYFASRDDENRARIAWIDVDPREPERILASCAAPLLSLGARGTFDDNGMMPSCVVGDGNRKYMYYMGWSPQRTVSYHVAIGLAVSDDGGMTYRRYASGPVLDRGPNEPFFCSAPCVLRIGSLWRIWYLSCTGWEEIDGHPEPKYHIKYAESDDGIAWRRDGYVCIDFDESTGAIARPWVLPFDDRYAMWFSYRGLVNYRTDPRAAYRIGYAESGDGLRWERRDDPSGLARSADGWDSVMAAYTNVIRLSGKLLCFYNGNGFGTTGIGYAVGLDEASPATRAVA
jgi:hypothetical protein